MGIFHNWRREFTAGCSEGGAETREESRSGAGGGESEARQEEEARETQEGLDRGSQWAVGDGGVSTHKRQAQLGPSQKALGIKQ